MSVGWRGVRLGPGVRRGGLGGGSIEEGVERGLVIDLGVWGDTASRRLRLPGD